MQKKKTWNHQEQLSLSVGPMSPGPDTQPDVEGLLERHKDVTM